MAALELLPAAQRERHIRVEAGKFDTVFQVGGPMPLRPEKPQEKKVFIRETSLFSGKRDSGGP